MPRRTIHTIKTVAEVNEEIACRLMAELSDAVRKRDRCKAKSRAVVLRQVADIANDPTLTSIADEAIKICKMIGVVL